MALGGGYQSTCVLGDDGAVRCWGQNRSGELGNGRGRAPAVVRRGRGRRRERRRPPRAGDRHRGARPGRGLRRSRLRDPHDRGRHLLGRNGSGQLGTGDTTPLLTPSAPLAFPDGAGFVPHELVLGNEHTCATSADGRIKCWGDNQQGQLGPGVTGDRHTPGADLRLRGRAVKALAAGGDHTCAILDGGAVKCWGRNADGQLGLGDLTNRGDGPGQMGDSLPEVALGATAIAVAAGAAHSCVVTSDGGVRCWGAGTAGQLGLGNNSGTLVPPSSAVALPGAATAVVAGDDFSCALLASGQAVCWGAAARGQLGTGEVVDHAAPAAPIGFPAKATALVAGARHACALLDDGRIACWGANDSGQLGLGDQEDRTRPTTVDTNGAGRARSPRAARRPACSSTAAR